ncbi:hypothetical protein GYMLUDRAFT_49327 [Collybiopsis luxurians FD-317 M1]|uniref:GST N-terminal domain-containing protein n=1 Tax=Collybiopsis luxurians FD-317 M1 TaxID=944289 RepID=A0A0D0BV31_9AGAR|nr:hypothetical protein GYMLUDRAFT_49327 [Collybiopsis luxurians FD-317 M1]
MTITLYDFPGKREEHTAWNPNVLKVRYSLAYKNLPYELVLVEYPDIEEKMKQLGASPTSTKADGSPLYTLPVIHDSATEAVVSDSFSIAQYLDDKYPSPPLFPNGTHAFHATFYDLFSTRIIEPIIQFFVPNIPSVLNPPSEEYFRRTRKEAYGMELERVLPGPERGEKEWQKVEESFGTLSKGMRKSDVLIMGGETPCFADFTVAGWLRSFKVVFGEQSKEWKDILRWHDGRWERLMKELEKYEPHQEQVTQESFVRL